MKKACQVRHPANSVAQALRRAELLSNRRVRGELMKTRHHLAIAAILAQGACGQIQSAEDAQAQLEAAMSDSEQAANELYMDDLTEASAEDEIEGQSDSSVTSDIDKRRLGQMSENLFKELDADESGSLTKAEFLAGPMKRAEDKSMTDDKKTKLTDKMSADFDKYAGNDALLSQDELKTLLSSVAPRVGKHRAKNHPGKQEDRVKESMQNLNNKFDTNKDGKISPEEAVNMRSQRKTQINEVRTTRLPPLPPPPPGGQGGAK